jgi:hypothetical protein
MWILSWQGERAHSNAFTSDGGSERRKVGRRGNHAKRRLGVRMAEQQRRNEQEDVKQ